MDTKEEFDKIGVNVITCLQRDGRWVFKHANQYYDMAPASFTEYILNPMIIGADRLIHIGCKLREIKNPQNGFWMLFSENYFPNSDVLFEFIEQKYDGWIYKVNEMNLKGLMPDQSAWICPYMKFYYPEPPEKLYLKIESIGD